MRCRMVDELRPKIPDRIMQEIMMIVKVMTRIESVLFDGMAVRGTSAMSNSRTDCDPAPMRNDRIGSWTGICGTTRDHLVRITQSSTMAEQNIDTPDLDGA
mmetsp:Transcript_17791/g.49344  ORF Transcript_17791/g.49344 Transcript_17791/m.49344 type:complete len:101 (+) Transcript_17791:685-987(+)